MSLTKHTLDEKLAILHEWMHGDENADEVASRHGIHAATLYTWKRKYVATDKEAGVEPNPDKEPTTMPRLPTERDKAMAARDVRMGKLTREQASRKWNVAVRVIDRVLSDEKEREKKNAADDAERQRRGGVAPMPRPVTVIPPPPLDDEREPPYDSGPAPVLDSRTENVQAKPVEPEATLALQVMMNELLVENARLRDEVAWLRKIVAKAVR